MMNYGSWESSQKTEHTKWLRAVRISAHLYYIINIATDHNQPYHGDYVLSYWDMAHLSPTEKPPLR